PRAGEERGGRAWTDRTHRRARARPTPRSTQAETSTPARPDVLSEYLSSHRRAAHARRHGRGAQRLRRRGPRPRTPPPPQPKDPLVPLRQLFFVSDPGDQAAVAPDIGELAELVDDLFRCSHQRVAAVTGDEMRFVTVERLGVQGLIVQPENLQEIAGSLP